MNMNKNLFPTGIRPEECVRCSGLKVGVHFRSFPANKKNNFSETVKHLLKGGKSFRRAGKKKNFARKALVTWRAIAKISFAF